MKRSYWAVSLVATALVACSSSDDDGKMVTPIDAGQTDAPASVVDSGVDAPVEAGPDGTKACDLLSASVLTTQPLVIQTAANKHPFAEAPTPAGGAIVNGTYRLASVNTYFDGTGATPAGRGRGTLELKSGLWEHAGTEYDIMNMPTTQNMGGGAYVVNGTEISPAPGPVGGPTSPGCGSSQFFSGNAGGLSGIGFTATPTGITFIRPNGLTVIVVAYTKDP